MKNVMKYHTTLEVVNHYSREGNVGEWVKREDHDKIIKGMATLIGEQDTLLAQYNLKKADNKKGG